MDDKKYLKLFLICSISVIAKGEQNLLHEYRQYDNNGIIQQLIKNDDLIRGLEQKLSKMAEDINEKSKQIEEIKSIIQKHKEADNTRTMVSSFKAANTVGTTTTTTESPTTTPDESVQERLDHLEELSKIHTLRSCHEYDEYGINTSGRYFIDPDGPLVGIEPFEVQCNFEDHSTEILHDHDGQTVVVDHCTEPHDCFRLDLAYPTKMEQMVALIDLSENCTQDITFNCFLAPLSVNGEAIGTWVNRNGGNESYFTGSNSGTHMCECGLTQTCSDSEHNNVCNCDASELPIEQNDSGIITDVSELPIMGFNYGDLLEYPDQYASILIGRLKCKGKKPLQPEEINDSCKNLKLNGESRSRNYALNDGSLAFCDMAKRITDGEIQKKIGDFQFKEPM